jgi:hypothetical protein
MVDSSLSVVKPNTIKLMLLRETDSIKEKELKIRIMCTSGTAYGLLFQ